MKSAEERADGITEWTEGICGDGAVILRCGQPVTISELLERLNNIEAALRDAQNEAYERAANEAETLGLGDWGEPCCQKSRGIHADDIATAIRRLKRDVQA